MNITLTGHGLEVTQALHDFTVQKIEKLENHFDNISRVNVTLGVEHHAQIAEATLIIKGTELHAKASSADMYNSIDDLSSKLNRQLDKHKGKILAKAKTPDMKHSFENNDDEDLE